MPKQLPRHVGGNYLLATLSEDDWAMIQPHLTEVSLDVGLVLEEPHLPIERSIFPVSGITSIIAVAPGRQRRIEAGLFGREGVSGIPVLLGAASPSSELRVQVPGHGLQIETPMLRRLLRESWTLQQHLLLSIQPLMTQMIHTALSNKYSSLEERLARWLLMCHDRIEGDHLNLTHEFMSVMLGMRRAGVTEGTQILEGKGMIRAKRAQITILDREGLEEESGGSYGVPEAEYARLFSGGKIGL